MQAVARYTVELRRPDAGWTALQDASNRARQAAEEMRLEGMPVRFLRSIFVPEDESCFFLYEAPSVEAVRAAVVRAQLRARLVQETINVETEEN